MNHEVLDRMRDDHRRVLAAMDDVEGLLPRAAEAGPRERLAEHLLLLEHQFATHMEAEDRVLIPALASMLPEARATLAELSDEHAELRALHLDVDRALRDPEGRVAVPLRDLIDLLRIHIRKEEAVVFHVAEQVLTEPQRAQVAALLSRTAPPAHEKG